MRGDERKKIEKKKQDNRKKGKFRRKNKRRDWYQGNHLKWRRVPLSRIRKNKSSHFFHYYFPLL